MAYCYELFFDSEDLNDFWGTSDVVLDNDTYELCAQSFYVRLDDDNINELDIDPNIGVRDNDEMKFVLAELFPETEQNSDDLINCVSKDSIEALYAFSEIDEDEYYSHI